MLTEVEGVLVCISFGAFLAISTHLWPRSIRSLPYGDPTQIKARMLSTALSTAIILAASAAVLQEPPEVFAATIGLRINGIVAAALLPPVLVHVAYFGAFISLAQGVMKLDKDVDKGGDAAGDDDYDDYDDGVQQAFFATFPNQFETWLEFCRDVLMAPLTEEIVFRCVTIPLLLRVAFVEEIAVVISAVMFSFAHLTVGCGAGAVKEEVFAQILYTFVFGVINGFAFVRTRHFMFVYIVHALSNFYNVPNLHMTSLTAVATVIGFAAFGVLFYIFTNPQLYLPYSS